MDLTFSEFDTVVRVLSDYVFFVERQKRNGIETVYTDKYLQKILDVREKIVQEQIAKWQEQAGKEHSDGEDS